MFLWVGSWEIRCFLVLGGDAEGFAELLFYVYFSFESRYRVRYFFYPTTLTEAFLEEEIEWMKELERFLLQPQISTYTQFGHYSQQFFQIIHRERVHIRLRELSGKGRVSSHSVFVQRNSLVTSLL